MFKCTICLSPEDDIGATPCGHIFCISCLGRHLEYRPSCPKCRRPCVMEVVLKLHADFDDDTTAPTNAPLLSTPHSFPDVKNGDTPNHDESGGLNETVGIDALANLAGHLTLDVDGESSRVSGIVELESIKQEEEEDDKVFLQLSRSTFGSLGQDAQDVAAARALAVTTSLVTLVTTLTSLLPRLKYSANLTEFTQEITSSLSIVTSKTRHMIALDNDIDRATRERDARRYLYIAASEREFNRHRMYKNAKEDYWTKQLEFAQEREVNSIQITRLESVVNATKSRAYKYEAKFIALGGERDSDQESESYDRGNINDDVTKSMPGAFPDVGGPPPRKRVRE